MKHSLKTRKKISVKIRKSWKRPDVRKAHIKKMKEFWDSPGAHERMSEILKKAHQRPEVKARHSRAVRKRFAQPGMFEFLSRVQRRHEKKIIKQFQKQGFEIVRNGWPDFVAIRNGKIRFIEAKGLAGKPSPQQKRMHEILKKKGIVVEIIYAK